jgi:nucleoside-diphosphate-sugar epimerase
VGELLIRAVPPQSKTKENFMRIFVTGATGFIGSAIVRELLTAGHQVLGLARSDASAAALAAAGAAVHRGDLENLDSLQSGAAAADGVIHTGFIHDFSRFKEVCETDRRAIGAIGAVLGGSERPFIVTSGTALLMGDRPALEADVPDFGRSTHPRIASDQAVAALAEKRVRVSLMRLPPSVHGVGDHGFVPMLINLAREKGVSAYVGEGLNRWPAVHRLDAARLYRLAVEQVPAPGTALHGVAEDGVAFREIAELIGKRLNLPVVSKSPEEAADHFGWFAHFAAIDNPTSSQQTRERFGWHPTQPGLLADIDQDGYFPA